MNLKHYLQCLSAPLLAGGLCLSAHAQPFSIGWFTVDGGGGFSASSGTFGTFTVLGTASQPDVGPPQTGGGFTITGGFWGFLGGADSAPVLRIRLAGNNAVISWSNPSTGFDLQQSTALLGSATTWSNVNQLPTIVGTDKQLTVPITASPRFYRLKRP